MYGLLSAHIVPALVDERVIPGLVLTEMLVGLGIGSIISLMFKAIRMAGAIISVQIGARLAPRPRQGGGRAGDADGPFPHRGGDDRLHGDGGASPLDRLDREILHGVPGGRHAAGRDFARLAICRGRPVR